VISSPRFVLSALTLGLLSAPMLSQAASIERSGQSILPIFEKGNYAEASYVYVNPDISGEVTTPTAGGPLVQQTGDDLSDEYGYLGAAVKLAPSDDSFIALIYDEPFGLDNQYGSESILSGAQAELNSQNYSLLVGGKALPNVWVYGGVAYQHIDANVSLPTAFGGYNLDTSNDAGGLIVGAAYEKPEIALRLAATYRSEIENKGTAIETTALGSAKTPFSVSTPQSVNLDFQTGVTPSTLLMVNLRWVDWTAFKVSPQNYGLANGGADLVNFQKDQYSGTIGVGQKLTDNLSASIKAGYDTGTGDEPSIFGPYEEKYTAIFGLKYSLNDIYLSAGAAYVWLADADITVGPSQVSYENNDALAFAAKVGYHF